MLHTTELTKRLLSRLLASFALFLVACAGPVGSGSDGGVELDDAGKADLYGHDDRAEPYDADEIFRSLSESTAVMIVPTSLRIGTNNEIYLPDQTLNQKLTEELGGPLCESERFREQPAPGFCSAFLIAPDLVATAGHCININRGCGETAFVFGFAHDNPESGEDVTHVEDDDYYRCASVIGHLYDRDMASAADLADRSRLWSDWAVVRLDRPVVGRQPLQLRRFRELSEGETVAALGYPGGVPLKVTEGEVVDADPELYFNTDLDIYQGNSGSVVVSEEGFAEGIVIRGTGGTSYERQGSCFVSQHCDDYDPTTGSGCVGNHVMRIEPVLRFVDSDELILQGTAPDYDANAIPDGHGEFVGEHTIEETGTIRFVTLNTGVYHQAPTELRISLERVETGDSVLLFDGPTLHPAGYPIFSRTTSEFDGQDAAGRWRIHVEDTRESGYEGSVGFYQIVIGTGQRVEPPADATFIGTACTVDEDCTFDSSARCHSLGSAGSGICTIDCEGFCPDRSGFATTFCVSLDDGATGSCLQQAHIANDQCADLAGTTAREASRFIGGSGATASSSVVCYP